MALLNEALGNVFLFLLGGIFPYWMAAWGGLGCSVIACWALGTGTGWRSWGQRAVRGLYLGIFALFGLLLLLNDQRFFTSLTAGQAGATVYVLAKYRLLIVVDLLILWGVWACLSFNVPIIAAFFQRVFAEKHIFQGCPYWARRWGNLLILWAQERFYPLVFLLAIFGVFFFGWVGLETGTEIAIAVALLGGLVGADIFLGRGQATGKPPWSGLLMWAVATGVSFVIALKMLNLGKWGVLRAETAEYGVILWGALAVCSAIFWGAVGRLPMQAVWKWHYLFGAFKMLAWGLFFLGLAEPEDALPPYNKSEFEWFLNAHMMRALIGFYEGNQLLLMALYFGAAVSLLVFWFRQGGMTVSVVPKQDQGQGVQEERPIGIIWSVLLPFALSVLIFKFYLSLKFYGTFLVTASGGASFIPERLLAFLPERGAAIRDLYLLGAIFIFGSWGFLARGFDLYLYHLQRHALSQRLGVPPEQVEHLDPEILPYASEERGVLVEIQRYIARRDKKPRPPDEDYWTRQIGAFLRRGAQHPLAQSLFSFCFGLLVMGIFLFLLLYVVAITLVGVQELLLS